MTSMWRFVPWLALGWAAVASADEGGLLFACHMPQTQSRPAVMASPPPRTVPGLRSWQSGTGWWQASAATRIVLEPASAASLRATAQDLATDIAGLTGHRPAVVTGSALRSGDIGISLSPCDASVSSRLGPEGYQLDIGQAVLVRANDARGAFYAGRSLLQMLMLSASPAVPRIPQGTALDYPRYRERAVMFDVGRKFASVAFLQSYIRFMGWYKLNTLHLHLNDQVQSRDGSRWLSASFRLRSDDPAMAALAPPDGQAYSREDWELLERTAAANGVSIVPEIDVPGHAGALVRARPDLAYHGDHPAGGTLDPDNPETLSYVESVFDYFLPWFRGPVIHIGGDEVNVNHGKVSVASQVHFINALAAHLQHRGKRVEVWGSAEFASMLDHRLIIQRWINWGEEAKINWGQQGFTWTESYGDWYVVPDGPSYFNPKGLSGDRIYRDWDHETPADASLADGPSGGQIAVWNDRGDESYDYPHGVHPLIRDAIPAIGQIFWRGQEQLPSGELRPYADFRPALARLQYGPGVVAAELGPWPGQ
ncbi:beta-N-acetylhexosaminidase [Frateuria aurantia]